MAALRGEGAERKQRARTSRGSGFHEHLTIHVENACLPKVQKMTFFQHQSHNAIMCRFLLDLDNLVLSAGSAVLQEEHNCHCCIGAYTAG